MVKVSQLEVIHDEYLYYKETWDTIGILKEGATAIIKYPERFLAPRPDEPEGIYKLRLNKLSYTPVMATAIKDLVSQLAKAPLYISGLEDTDFWAKFQESVDGSNKDERELLTEVFSTLLYYGRVFLAVDSPARTVAPRSFYEERQTALRPYVIVYDPLAIINWGKDWYLSRQLNIVSEPLEDIKKVVRWTIWSKEKVTVYEAEVKEDLGVITEVKINGKWTSPWSPKAILEPISEVPTVDQRCHMVSLKLPTELWTGNSVFLKQIQHLRIESSWTDAGTLAGTIQRIFTPLPEPPEDDPMVTRAKPDYTQIKTGNPYVLIGSSYEFKESSGSALNSLSMQLEKIEAQIKDLVSMRFASVTPGALEQSGKSKEIDRDLLQASMSTYGVKVAQLYQDVLQIVAEMAGVSSDIKVHGLDQYRSDSLSTMLEQSVNVMGIQDNLPVTARKIWFHKLASLLVGSVPPEDEEKMQKEIEALFDNTEVTVEKLMETFDLTEEEAKEILDA